MFIRVVALAGALAMLSSSAKGQDVEAPSTTDLGRVTVYASPIGTPMIGAEPITQATLQQFSRDTLDDALLLSPGTSVSALGARNETNVWIRGFDRWRVPLYQDGIPVYLPVDNRIDFARFTTADLAEIQVSRGFASVIDGPGAMGGSINLVSRLVAKPLEADARVGLLMDSRAATEGWKSDLFLGTRQGNWFAQGAGTFSSQSHFRLSDDYVPGTLQGAGDRIQSSHQDYKINLKGGYTASNGAEYALNVIDQVGRKGNPPPDGTIPPNALRTVKYWKWPSWDKKSLYFLSRNPIDDHGSFVKTRLYYDRFYNQLDSYDDIGYVNQNFPKSFDSTYDDRAAGGSVELDKNLQGIDDTIRAAVHYRWDHHSETQAGRNAPGAPWYQQPWEFASETTGSLALENIYHPTGAWDVIAGASYDWRHLNHARQWVAQGKVPPFGYSFAYPVADKHALNGELAVVFHYSKSGSVSFSYADRARFPTLFEMYSTRFGTFVNNPDLKPERSHYAQAGVSDIWAGTRVALSAFIARIDDVVTAVALSPTVSENQNTGSEQRKGFEVELSRPLLAGLDGGIKYADLSREVRAGGFVPTDTPDHTFFAFLDWRPVASLEIVPSLDLEGRRWLQSATNNLVYYRGGDFTRLGLKIAWRPVASFTAEAGVRNLTDRNYVVADGYHAPGRQYYANLRVTF